MPKKPFLKSLSIFYEISSKFGVRGTHEYQRLTSKGSRTVGSEWPDKHNKTRFGIVARSGMKFFHVVILLNWIVLALGWFGKRNCSPYARVTSLLWRHNGPDGISNHQPHDCLLNRLFGHRSKKTSKLCVTGLCAGNSPETGEFPAQMASNAEDVSIWWRHHVKCYKLFANIRRASSHTHHVLTSRYKLLSNKGDGEWNSRWYDTSIIENYIKKHKSYPMSTSN